MRRLIAAFLIAFSALAEKRPVTVADAAATSPTQPAITWAPDGKRFAFRESGAIWQYDVRSGTKKQIVSLDRLREKAIKAAASESFDWQNRRVVESAFQWSNSGKEMLVTADADLFRVNVDNGEWSQLTATADAERDPKLSPD